MLVVAAGLLGVLVVVGLGIAAWLLVASPQSESQALEVPSLEGEDLAAARQEVGDDFELVRSEENSNEPKGTILSQDPTPGAEVPRGTEISVVVSTGQPPNLSDTSKGTVAQRSSQSEANLVQAVEDYYEAVDREDWSYTYENLDSKTQSMFTEEEWYLKNQYIADTEGLELSSMDVRVNDSASDLIVSVTVYRIFKNGTSITRDTYFVWEDGAWKHRFSQEEINIFMPGTSYEEFVTAP